MANIHFLLVFATMAAKKPPTGCWEPAEKLLRTSQNDFAATYTLVNMNVLSTVFGICILRRTQQNDRRYREGLQMSKMIEKPNEEILQMLGLFHLERRTLRCDRGLQNPGGMG